jgi:hypothetical protein
MAFVLLIFLALILLAAALFLALAGPRRGQGLFKPVRRLKGTDPRIGGRLRAGPVCFVTGMSRASCACAFCQDRGED